MKTIEELITSFETKAAMDEYSVVSKEDLLTSVYYLKTIVDGLDRMCKIPLNSDRVDKSGVS